MNANESFKQRLPMWAMALAFYFVIFIWDFFTYGVFALGFNASLYLIAFTTMAYLKLQSFGRGKIIYFIPLYLIALSYSIFENPFINAINILVMPIIFYFVLSNGFKRDFYFKDMFHIFFASFLLPIVRLESSWGLHLKLFQAIKIKNIVNSKVRKVLKGLVVLSFLLLFIILPLLSSADSNFAFFISNIKINIIDPIFDFIFDSTIIWRGFFLILMSVGIVASLSSWSVEQDQQVKQSSLDPIVTGIVISGILICYLLFLLIHIQNLCISILPTAFKATELLVKQGFWQLLFLTAFNISLFFYVHCRSTKVIQVLLTVFTMASLILLTSATYKLFLYVFYYGLSYEKWYASYTILYCTIVYIILGSVLLKKQSTNVIRVCLITLMWMYAIVTILPVEIIIIKTNMALIKRTDTRLQLQEMRMLSADILPIITKNIIGPYQEQKTSFDPTKTIVFEPKEKNNRCKGWKLWVQETSKVINRKVWYEHNISSIIAKMYLTELRNKMDIKCQQIKF